MAYTPVSWEDYPSVNTPISANNLNHMDTQIKTNADDIEDIKGDITTLNNNLANCWKIARTNATFTNVTINANGDHQFLIPIPDGVTNIIPIYARATTLSLACTNMYKSSNNMFIYLSNITNTAITKDSITVEVTYAYT
jgi:hypothetical protein